jgi:diguanylate cyclase (GGDEF)-like protein
VAIFSAYFFTPAQTAAHLMLVGIVYAAAFALSPVEPDNPAAHWVVSLTVIALAAVVIHALVNARRRLEAEREELLAETIEQARTDALTGLPNRRAWLELLEHEVARAQRTGRPLCVAMLDLDHFKLFNDEHGHIAGDQLLAETAAEWSRVLRPTDTMARYGGEEFAVLLPECGLTHAIAVVQRLRATTARGQRCSAGLACWDGRESPMDLIARADARLYEAKEQGRDRVVPPDAEAVFAM